MKTKIFWIILLSIPFHLFAQDNHLTKLNKAPAGTFTIAVMSDTQNYTDKGTNSDPESRDNVINEIFDSQTKWLINNYKDQNIIFVSHAGDVVNINDTYQWEVANKYLNRIYGIIPFGISLGNHDMESNGNSELYQTYFSEDRFSEFEWYGGSFKNNTNSYQLLSFNDLDIIILHIECNATDSVINWANDVLNRYKNRFAIITTHMFLGPREKPVAPEDYFDKPKGIMNWNKTFGLKGNTPQQLWDKCFKYHENIRLIISGDQSRSNALHREIIGKNGNIVHALLSDYSSNNGGGLRLYRFYPLKGKIEVISYNTVLNNIIEQTKIVPEKKEHNFIINTTFN